MDVKGIPPLERPEKSMPPLERPMPPLERPEEKKAKFVSRDPSFSFKNVWDIFKDVRGKAFLNPGPRQTIPKMHSREATYDLYSRSKQVVFYHTHIEPLQDDLYMQGQLPNGASVALKLLNLRPFFFMSTPSLPGPNLKQSLMNYAEALTESLNDRDLWPKGFDSHGSRGKRPVVKIEVEYRTPGVAYAGVVPGTNKRKQFAVFKVSFWNLSCWRYYRGKIAKGEAGMDYKPILYHEQDFFTFVQMLFNENPMTHGCWIQLDATKCHWIPKDAPDSFGGYSDVEWTEAKLDEQEAEAEAEMEEEEEDNEGEAGDENAMKDEEKSGGTKKKKKKKRKKPIKRFHTRAVIEGEIDYRELKARTDLEGSSALVLQIVDTETASGKVTRFHLLGKKKPPLPDDELLPDEAKKLPMDTIDHYRDLLSRVKETTSSAAKSAAGGTAEKKMSAIVAKKTTKKRKADEADKSQKSMKSFFGGVPKPQLPKVNKKRKREHDDSDPSGGTKLDHLASTGPTGDYLPLHLFPDPNNAADPVMMISTEIWIYGDDAPVLKVVHTLGTAMERPEMHDVVKFRWSERSKKSEHAMLTHW